MIYVGGPEAVVVRTGKPSQVKTARFDNPETIEKIPVLNQIITIRYTECNDESKNMIVCDSRSVTCPLPGESGNLNKPRISDI
jgi:hypothetical protein